MRTSVVILICLLFLQSACYKDTKEKSGLNQTRVDKNYTWTTHSIFMGDTNICVKLPNVISLKTSEIRCFADPFSTNISYTSLIDTDTVYISTQYIHVGSKFFDNYSVNKIDARQIENEILKLKAENPKTEFYDKSFHEIDNIKYYILKYKQQGIVFYSIKFFGNKGVLKLTITNLKMVELAESLIQSIRLEKDEVHFCF